MFNLNLFHSLPAKRLIPGPSGPGWPWWHLKAWTLVTTLCFRHKANVHCSFSRCLNWSSGGIAYCENSTFMVESLLHAESYIRGASYSRPGLRERRWCLLKLNYLVGLYGVFSGTIRQLGQVIHFWQASRTTDEGKVSQSVPNFRSL